MKKFLTNTVLPLASLGFAFYFFWSVGRGEQTAEMTCTFRSVDGDGIHVPNSQTKADNFLLRATLSGRSVIEELNLVQWSANGTATYSDAAQKMMGPILVSQEGRVTFMLLNPDKSVGEVTDFSIRTPLPDKVSVSDRGKAFIWFRIAQDRNAHPFRYDCKIVQNERWLGLF